LRLFGCACCRTIWELLPDDRCRRAVEVAELLADGLISASEAEAVGALASQVDHDTMPGVHPQIAWRAVNATSHLLPDSGENWQVWQVWGYVATAREGQLLIAEGASDEMLDTWSEQCVESGSPMGWTATDPVAPLITLLRCIFGNPFRPVAFAPHWRSETAVSLATGIYDERAFDRLPILADALEEAGCDNADVLAHCRGDGPHARGCWVVDGVLGRE
jgi:hypothetical protein